MHDMIRHRSARSAALELADQCRRQATGVLALLGPAGNLLARRLVDLHDDRAPLERWWPRLSSDYSYWRCLTSPEPMLCGTAQLAMASLLLTRGLDRRGALLLQLSGPYLDAGSHDVVKELVAALVASWDELRVELAPGVAAHDRGDFDAALRCYDEVLRQWPNHPWPWHEKALTELELRPVTNRRRHPTVRAALLRDPFYVNTVAMIDPDQARWVSTDIVPLTEQGDVSPSSVTRFGAAAMRSAGDHWSAAHARVLMRHMGVPFNSFLLDASLTELGVETTYDKVTVLTGGTAEPVDERDDGEDPIVAVRQEIDAQWKAGRRDEAVQTAAAAVAALRRSGGEALTGMLVGHGLLLTRLGRNDEAADIGREVVERQAEVTDRGDVAAAHSMIARSMTNRHQYVDAIGHLQQARDEYDNWPGSSLTQRASVRLNLGHTYELLRDYVAARRLLQEALHLLSSEFKPDPITRVRIYLPLAKAEAHLGQRERAFGILGEAERLLESAGAGAPPELLDHLDETRASLHHLIGDEEARIADLQAMLDRLRATHGADHPGNYVAENNLALALGPEHRDTARDLLNSSLRKRIQLFGDSSPAVAIAYNNLAVLALDGDDHQEAADWYERCLDIRRRTLAPTNADLLDAVAGLGNCRVQLGDVAGGLPLLLEAVRADFERATTAAGATHMDLQAMSHRRQWVLDLLATLTLRGDGIGASDRDAVINALVNSKTLATGVVAARPRDGRRPSHQLTTVVGQYTALIIRGLRTRSVKDQYTRLRQLADKLDELLAGAEGDGTAALPYVDVRSRLRAELPPSAAFVDLSAFRPTTDGPSDADAVYLGTVVSADGVETMVELAPVAEITRLVETFRDEMRMFSSAPGAPAVSGESAQRVIEIGRGLYQALFAPLEPVLARFTHLVLSLDGPMAQFPAACLVDAEGRFGVERWMFTYLSSVHDLHPLPPRRHGGEVVVFADPAYGTPAAPPTPTGVAPLSEALATTWTALPGTRREMLAIAEAVGADRVTTFTGADASKTNLFRLARPRILHLATHAFYVARPTILVLESDSDEPLKIGTSTDFRTGVVLAGANERRHLPDSSTDDGIVTAGELSIVLDLSATELVVLSACETAVGELRLGDSVHGVRRACHTAGAHAVIAGLWPVSDLGAARLMRVLYDRLAATASPGAALHEATLHMLRRARMAGRTPHPHSWAPFVVSGSVHAVLRPAFAEARDDHT
jgi:CHAT domain-containing protein/tetratricopeptide (TPR) repeat protein